MDRLNQYCKLEEKYKINTKKLAERIVNDINSPIATIEISLYLLSQEADSENIKMIKLALQQIRDITQCFLDLSLSLEMQ